MDNYEKNDMVLNSSILSVEVNKPEWYTITIYRTVYAMADLC